MVVKRVKDAEKRKEERNGYGKDVLQRHSRQILYQIAAAVFCAMSRVIGCIGESAVMDSLFERRAVTVVS